LANNSAIDPEDPSVCYNVACSFALLGKIEEAMKCFEKAVQKGAFFKQWAEHDSDLDSLRSHPRFQAVMKDL
jgi:hypothetical protein